MRGSEGREEVASLIIRIEQKDDPREGFALVMEEIERRHEAGDAVPEELVRMHKALETELMNESRGW